jgi:hypothetical protein
LPDSNAELVLQTERPEMETDLAVESVDEAVREFVAAGGRLLHGPFEIQIVRECAGDAGCEQGVVEDGC